MTGCSLVIFQLQLGASILSVLLGVEADDGVGEQVVEIPVVVGAALQAIDAAVVVDGGGV